MTATKPYNPDPRAPENNLHHTVSYRNYEEWAEDEFGKGPFDPDFVGYPGEQEAETKE